MLNKQGMLFGIAVLFGCVMAWLLLSSKTHEASKLAPDVKTKQFSSKQKSKATSTTSKSSANQEKETPSSSEKKIEEVLKRLVVPITFYGKVVDEKGNPVAGATATFSASDLSETGNTRYEAISQSDGQFCISGIQGGGILVKVTKEGYYEPKDGGQYFDYNREGQNHIPDPNNPVIFRLHMKGQPAELVRIEKGFNIPRDGTPIEVSLLTGKKALAGQGHLKVECWTFDQTTGQKEGYDWKCRISVPEGGLVESVQEFDFEAPEAGYRPFDEINMYTKTPDRWSRNAQKTYFLKLRDGNYARIKFEMIAAGDHFFRIESYLNPDKSRNLEYDKSKEIEVKVR